MSSEETAMDCVKLLEDADDALGHLAPQEELVLRLRFGIGGRQRPLERIARRVGLEPRQLRTVESRALGRLRQMALTAEAGV
jgi:DNA-directed RNA polymerase sigma subunit (sigma70/sigma32)